MPKEPPIPSRSALPAARRTTVAAVLVATALLLIAAANAQGATFFAAPGGGNGACSNENPCTLANAVERTRPDTGDTVFVKPGTYTDETEDLGLAGRITLRQGTNLVGLGPGLPRIVAHNPNAVTTIDGGTGAKIEFIEVVGEGSSVVRLKGASAEGLVAESRATLLGAVTCDAFNPTPPGPLNSVVCLNRAVEGTALRVGTRVDTDEAVTQLRGVTAIATGTGSIGIEVLGTGNSQTQTLPIYRADIALAIAQGRDRDVLAISEPATVVNRFSPDVRADLTSSSFITSQTIRGGVAPVTITSPNANENLRQRAIFVDGFHQLENSPTVDRGRVGADVVPAFDIDRVSRPVGPAPDIGADELGGPPTETEVACSPRELRTHFLTNCRAIVSAESAPAPTGRVLLTSSLEQTAINTPDCALTERSPTESVCNFLYAPTLADGHGITAAYSSFTHERSEGSEEVIVIEGIETETRIECDSQSVQVGGRSECQVSVRELGGGAFPHSVRGTVDLQSAGDGLRDPGFFTPSTCRIEGGEEARCEVTYTANEAGSGPHKVFATFRSADVHLLSTGTTDIAVTGESRPRGETATSVSCEPALVERATATQCRVVVVDVPLGSEAPEGFVELQSNGDGRLSTDRCALQAAGGLAECRFSYIPLEEEQQDLFATYTGQLTRKASQGQTALLVTEEKGPLTAHSATSISCAPSPVQARQETTCNVSVFGTGSSAAPTGTVQIGSDGLASAPESCELEAGATGEGTCSFTYTPRRAEGGSHRIFATYLGDELFEASGGETTLPVFTLTAASLTCTPNPVLVKDGSVCRIVVSGAQGGDETSFQGGRAAADEEPIVPTGSVGFESAAPGSFSENGICDLEPLSETSSACVLTYVPSSKVPGNHVITAEYEGDAEFDARAATATVQARANPSTVNFACTPNPAPLGSLVDCVATVVSSRADTVPTGKLEFRTDRGNGRFKGESCDLAPVPDSANEASCGVGYEPGRAGSSGTHLLEARYGGDAVHAGDDAAATLEVDGNQPDLTVVCTPDGVRNGASSGCEVTATDLKQPRRPLSGNVRFSSDRPGEFGNGVPACELQEREVGVASCSLGYFPARDEFGPHTVTAEYLGDPDHDRAQATALVNLVRDTTTSARCVSSAGGLPEDTLEKDQAASCTVTVIDATGDSAPGGEVRFAGAFLVFNDPLNPVCELQPTGADRSSCEIDLRSTQAGETALLPSYRGSDVHAGSDGRTPLQVVDRAPTRVRLDCAPRAMALDEPSECTVSVQSLAVPPVQPTGQVTLASDRDGAFDPAATCDLEEAGSAADCTLTYTPHEVGPHLLEARYGGDQAHEPNEAGAVFEVTEDGGGDEGEDGEDEENGGEDDNPRTHPTTTVLECVPAGTGVREPTTCSARVTDTGASPTSPGGSISFDSDRGDPFVPIACALEPVDEETSSCSASYEPTTAGLHRLTASYGGDGTHERGAIAAAGLSVSAARTDTVTSVLCVPAQLANGETTTCTAAVTGSADAPSAPTGRVEFDSNQAGFFEDSGCELPSSPRPGERTSTCSVTFTPVEVLLPAHEVKASFVGDVNHRGSSGTTEIELISADEAEKSPTLATLACEPTEVEVDTATSCVATVVDTGSPRQPLSGRIELAVEPAGGLSVDGCGIAGVVGRASCEFTFTPNVGGSRLLTATFAGDAAHRGSSAEAEVFAFEQPDTERSDTSTRLVCGPSEVAVGTAAGCTAVVTDEGDPTAPFTGRVEFRSDQLGVFSEATCAADEAAGTLTCNAAFGPLALGLHRLEATFVGDAAHRSSSDGAEVTAVDPDGDEDGGGDGGGDGGDGDEDGQEGEDGTTLVCAPDALRTSQASTCTATVTDEEGVANVPSGRVDFSTDQAGAFGSGAVCELAPAGADSASCAVSYTPIEVGGGSHRVTAVYDGDGDHQRGVGRDRIAVTAEDPERGATETDVVCDPNRVAAGEDSTCFVKVADLSETDPVVPTGTVEFASSRAGLFSAAATCTLVPIPGDESANCEIAYTPVEFGSGDHKVFATYSGSTVHRPSQGVDQVAVEPEAGPQREVTQTALACVADSLKTGQPTQCVATVTAAAGIPGGDVSFDSNGAGQFSAATCALQAAATATAASCQVTYTPSAVGAGTHRVFATYAGSGTHLPSQGDDSVAVEAAPNGGGGGGDGGGGGGGNGNGGGAGGGNGAGNQPKPPATPPDTSIKKMKPKKGAKRAARKVVKYLFLSNQPGSTFQCQVDKGPFKPCKSPYKLPKPKKAGTHTLQVRAVNPQGIADPTPAVLKWRVAKARP